MAAQLTLLMAQPAERLPLWEVAPRVAANDNAPAGLPDRRSGSAKPGPSALFVGLCLAWLLMAMMAVAHIHVQLNQPTSTGLQGRHTAAR